MKDIIRIIRIEPPRVRTVMLRHYIRDQGRTRYVRLAFPYIIFVENHKQHVFVSQEYPKDFIAFDRALDVEGCAQIYFGFGCAVPFYEFPLTAHMLENKIPILSRVVINSHISVEGNVCYSDALRYEVMLPWGEKFWNTPFKVFDYWFVKDWEKATTEKGLAASKMALRHQISSRPEAYTEPYEDGDWVCWS